MQGPHGERTAVKGMKSTHPRFLIRLNASRNCLECYIMGFVNGDWIMENIILHVMCLEKLQCKDRSGFPFVERSFSCIVDFH